MVGLKKKNQKKNNKKPVTYAKKKKTHPKMVNPLDIAGERRRREEEDTKCRLNVMCSPVTVSFNLGWPVLALTL